MKKLLALILALALVATLAGCNGNNDTKNNTEEETKRTVQLQTGNIEDARLKVGDTMYDITVTDADGNTLVLSQVLAEKKMVLLNFWFEDCYFCKLEFPYMNEAYLEYKDDIEILAINPFDSAKAIAAFQEEYALSFPMASCSPDVANAFSIQGYPTSVLIDRDGVICMVEVGALPDAEAFTSLFAHFTADDYEQTLLKNGYGDLPN